ncbi:protein translocase subunit SecF [Acetobacter sp. CAG:977]|nr:protein translocase subunit SecF [Acetobacter sp. CAG:977]
MRLISLFTKSTNIDFIGLRKYAFFFSGLLVLISIVSLATKGLNYGIDFKGGILMEVQSEQSVDMKIIREKLAGLNVDLQPVGEDGTEVLITALGQGTTEQEQMKIVKVIRDELGNEFSVRRTEMVGPRVGSELIRNSIIAVILGALVISIYIWMRFEWEFALGVMISIVHDILITLGLFSVCGLDFNMTIVAGLMMLAGYSTNDTIVSYDRMRENLHKYRKMPIPEMINKTANDMLPRTIMTGISTILALIVMLLIGGEALEGFAIAMLFGIIVGTYSSVYVAMPLLMYLDVRKTMENSKAPVSPYDHVG